jgi:hypothetical protein
MKKIKILRIFLIGTLLSIIGFTSCKKIDIEPKSTFTDLEMAPGGWRIASFQWHDRSDNNQFSDYIFQFKTDGIVTAIHNGIKENGNWSKGNSNLKIVFTSIPLNELNNNWTIVYHTENTAELRGLSPFDNSTEFILFSKINSMDIEK